MPGPGSINVAERTRAVSRDALVQRGDDGVWRYAGTSVQAVGAKDRTLAEVLEVREIRVPGRPPEAVVLSISEIVKDSRLNWVLQAGTRLRGGEEDMFEVPWPVWQERADTPVDAWLPERDSSGLSRQLAIAEREVRFDRASLEASTARRSKLALLGTKLGMTRRQIAGILGLSAGRIQQLCDEAADPQSTAVRRTIDDARELLRHAGDRLDPTKAKLPSGWTSEKVDDVIAELLDVGLLEAADGQRELLLTDLAMRLRDDAIQTEPRRAKQRNRVDA